MEHVIGIDIGTSSVKAVLVNAAGRIVSSQRKTYPTHYPAPLAQEQDPEDWLEATTEAVADLLEGAIAGSVRSIGLTGQMSALVLTDRAGQPVRPAMLLADGRAEAVLTELEPIRARLEELVRMRPAAVFLVPKLLWVRKYDPMAFAKAHRLMGSKDYVRMRLTGTWASDGTEMSNSLCFDLERRMWATDVIRALGLPEDLWPPILPSTAVAGHLRPDMARRMGLSPGIPVIVGAADMPTSLLAAGVTDERQLLISTGSAMPVLRLLPSLPRKPIHGITYHLHVDGRVYGLASVLHAGTTFAWWARLLQMDVSSFEAAAQRAKVCLDGAILLPFLGGRGSPDFHPSAVGTLHGLRSGHDLSDVALAVYLGVACHIAEASEGLRGTNPPLESVVVAGGGASTFLSSILATLLGHPVEVLEEKEVSAYGAALLALHVVGDGPALIARRLPRRRVDPERRLEATYQAVYARYQDLVERLKPTWVEKGDS